MVVVSGFGRRLVRLLALVVALVAVTGCVPVLMVGDSVTVGAGSATTDAVVDDGWALTHDGEVGRTTAEGLEVLRARKEGFRAYVIELGYNDAWHRDYRARLRAVLDEVVGADRIVVVNMAEVQPYYVTGNQIIREEVARTPNAVIADWARVAAANPHYTHSDGIHLTSAGNTALAELIAATLGPAPQS